MSFKNPDLSLHGIAPFWFWNDRLTPKRIVAQVRRMADAGLRNFLIHARWGLGTPYLTAEWWRMVDAALTAARAHGCRVWFYDEYNYPSGICGFKITSQEKFREKYLVPACATTSNRKEITIELPKGDIIAAYAYPVANGRIDEAQALDISGAITNSQLSYQPENSDTWRIYVFVMLIEALEGWGKYSVNYLDPAPTKEFIRLTHEEYKKRYRKLFGNQVPCFFLDEPRFNNAIPWTADLPAYFKKSKGYDIRPYLALLCENGTTLTTRTRCDWYDVISAMYSSRFFKPIGDWCRKNKIGLTGHLMAEETLGGNTRYSGHGFKPYRHFSMPGVDHLGRGIGGVSPRLVASAAHRLGNRPVACEVFAGCGQDFNMEQMVTMTHWLFCQGVTHITPHAFFYSMRGNRKNDWPPSLFYQWKDWKKMPGYAQRTARLTGLFTGGRHAADIALMYPLESYHAAYRADTGFKTGYNDKGPVVSPECFAIEKTYQETAHALAVNHHGFDIIDTQALDSFSIQNKKLIDTRSGESFSLLVIPRVTTLPVKTARSIFRYVKAGGKVILIGAIPGNSTRRENDPEIKSIFKQVIAYGKGKVKVIKDGSADKTSSRSLLHAVGSLHPVPDVALSGSKHLVGDYPELDTRIHDPYVHRNLDDILRKKRGGVSVYHYIKKAKHLFLFANLVPEPQTFNARFRDTISGKIRLLYPGTGNETIVDSLLLESVRKLNSIQLTVPALESVVVEFKAE